jgi:NTP pyrophosphatase (non-canonical NTP hydrolase)
MARQAEKESMENLAQSIGGNQMTLMNAEQFETMFSRREAIYNAITAERNRQEQLKQNGKFLWTCADNHGSHDNERKLAVLSEEVGEVAHEVTDEMIFLDKLEKDPCEADHILKAYRSRLRAELVQVAAVCVAWIEALDKVHHGEK